MAQIVWENFSAGFADMLFVNRPIIYRLRYILRIAVCYMLTYLDIFPG
jgi:hypothetical protein